jgi:hypothetical protein
VGSHAVEVVERRDERSAVEVVELRRYALKSMIDASKTEGTP